MKPRSTRSMKLKLTVLAVVGAFGVAAVGAARAPLARAASTVATYSLIGSTLQQVKAELNLTNEQQAKIQGILADAVPRGIAIHDDGGLSAGQKRTRLRELRNSTRGRIEQLLNVQQRQTARKLIASARPRARMRLEQVAAELNLSPQQKTEVKPILASAFKRGVSIKDDMNLTLGQKAVKAQQLAGETQGKLATVLSPAQMASLKRLISVAKADLAAMMAARVKARAA